MSEMSKLGEIIIDDDTITTTSTTTTLLTRKPKNFPKQAQSLF